ncbi:MAG: hypothetical protein E7212_11960 [Clostridium sartagoforme]|nr:hypothetical protein [Clostridium sartagoforme]
MENKSSNTENKEYYNLIKKILKWVILSIIMGIPISYIISGFYDILVKKKIPKEKSKIFQGEVHKNKS